PLAVDGLYEHLADAGLGYGPEFQGLRAVWKRGDELFAEVQLPESLAKEARLFGLHPALFDAALHALALHGGESAGEVVLPFSFHGVSLHAACATSVRV